MTLELSFFALLAIAFASLSIHWWNRRNSAPGGPFGREAQSPFPLAKLAQRIFDPADFETLAGQPDLLRELIQQRRSLAHEWTLRARNDVAAWFSEHRAVSGASEAATLDNEWNVLWTYAKLRASIAGVQFVSQLVGPQHVTHVFRSIQTASILPELRNSGAALPEGGR